MKFRLVLVTVLAAWGGVAAGFAQNGGDESAIRTVIEGQWSAFSHDDAETAFSFASPEVRDLFSDAEGFLAMVRDGYPMVYHHATVRFLEPRILGPFAFQTVRMLDQAGAVWLVRYQLRRQPDGVWKIGGVRAVPGDDVPALEPPSTGA